MTISIARELAVPVGGAAMAGVLSHVLYFVRGEHHKQAVILAQLMFIIPTVLTIGLYRIGQHPLLTSAAISGAITTSYLASLFTSMTIYRVLFHPLKHYPGPYFLKFSKFVHLAQITNFDSYKKLDMWHATYGEYVRVGPGELSIVDPEAVEAIMGSRSSCIKAPWYDGGLPLVSVHQCRDRVEHDKRRRVWDRGFSMKALDAYESRVVGFANDLAAQIKSFGGKTLNASLWFNYYSFDVMGELAFGESFDMLKTGERHDAISMLHEGQKPIGVLTPMPWLMIILMKIPGLSTGYNKWIAYAETQVQKRKQRKPKERDVMSWLLEADPMAPGDPFRENMWLVGDARLIIVAGSDTTAATLSYMFYHLAHDTSQQEKLRKELVSFMKPGGTFDIKELANASHLNGLINETLRLHPPVPSGLSRQTPPEGITIGSRRIPGNTIVSVPLWTMSRSPKAFVQPLEFIPERWYSKPELVLNKNAYAPFSLGRYGCVGKNLALMELRTVAADLVTKFSVSFAPGESGHKLLHESEDYFTIGLADLMLQFTERN